MNKFSTKIEKKMLFSTFLKRLALNKSYCNTIADKVSFFLTQTTRYILQYSKKCDYNLNFKKFKKYVYFSYHTPIICYRPPANNFREHFGILFSSYFYFEYNKALINIKMSIQK